MESDVSSPPADVYTQERLTEMAEELKTKNIQKLVELIKNDFLEEFTLRLWSRTSRSFSFFRKNYNSEVVDIRALFNAIRKVFPDIKINIIPDYSGDHITVSLDPWTQKDPQDL